MDETISLPIKITNKGNTIIESVELFCEKCKVLKKDGVILEVELNCRKCFCTVTISTEPIDA